MKRVVSLIPSATEIVCALGLEKTLVGRSHSCDYPSWVRRLPAMTCPKLNVETISTEIDTQVTTLIRDGLSVYKVDERRLRDLAPDIIITQDQCEVCAASLADVENAVRSWMEGRAPGPNALDEATFARLGDSLGTRFWALSSS